MNLIIDNILEDLRRLIENTLNDESLLTKIVANSILHDNGFLKVTLQERMGGIGYRIHKWEPGYSDSNIHSHRWNMYSLLLDGSYSASEYMLSQEGSSYYRYSFLPNSLTDYDLISEGAGILSVRSFKLYSKGDGYYLKTGDLHKICEVHEQGALTAMLSWGPSVDGALVFSEKQFKKEVMSHRHLNHYEVIAVITEALESLNSLTFKNHKI